MIYFKEEDHSYRLDDPINGELCVSATTIIELFKKPYNLEFWSWYTALRTILNMEKDSFSSHIAKNYYFRWNEDFDHITRIAEKHGVSVDEMRLYQNIVKADWKKENKKSTDKGSNFHSFAEGTVYKNNGLIYGTEHARLSLNTDDLANLHDPKGLVIAPEIKLYNRRYRISGTADKVLIFPNKVIDVDDWKTNKEIKETSYKGKQKMLGPLSHIQDCNANHYKIQVSLYAWMLEQYGYKVGKLKFSHVELDPLDPTIITKLTEYPTDYLKKEVEDMLEYFDLHREKLLSDHKQYKESLK